MAAPRTRTTRVSLLLGHQFAESEEVTAVTACDSSEVCGRDSKLSVYLRYPSLGNGPGVSLDSMTLRRSDTRHSMPIGRGRQRRELIVFAPHRALGVAHIEELHCRP